MCFRKAIFLYGLRKTLDFSVEVIAKKDRVELIIQPKRSLENSLSNEGIVRTFSVAFRSAKVALIRGAKGDNGTVIYRTILIVTI